MRGLFLKFLWVWDFLININDGRLKITSIDYVVSKQDSKAGRGLRKIHWWYQLTERMLHPNQGNSLWKLNCGYARNRLHLLSLVNAWLIATVSHEVTLSLKLNFFY